MHNLISERLSFPISEPFINTINNKYITSTTNIKLSENNQTQSNLTQCTIQTYDSNLKNYLSCRNYMLNNTNKKEIKNKREKKVAVRKKNKRNISGSNQIYVIYLKQQKKANRI